MSAHPLSEWFFGPETIEKIKSAGIAIVISQSSPGQLHTGIVYRYKEEFRFLELCWHHILRNDKFAFPSTGVYWVMPKMTADKKIMLGVRFMKFGEDYKLKIPYGHGTPFAEFDEQENLIIKPECIGFTCATLVAFLFESFGHKLIDWDSWIPREEDAKWVEHICKLMREHDVEADHILKVSTNINAIRVRPEEVSAAVSKEEPPCEMVYCEPIGKHIFEVVTGVNPLGI